MKEIWTLSEHKNGKLHQVSIELLAWGRKLLPTDDYILCSIILANKMADSEIQKLTEYGVNRIYLVQHELLRYFLVEPYAKVLVELIEKHNPEVIIAPASTTGRTIMPYVSALVHGGLTADCTQLEIEPCSGLLLQTRPAIGGNILATIKTPNHRPQMATVRPRSIELPSRNIDRTAEVVKITPEFNEGFGRVIFEGFIPNDKSSPGIDTADVVIAGGKGLKTKGNFDLVEELSSVLGGAVGASRPPVDQGWRRYSEQVGLSGQTISPKLYIACGISGSIQHLAGIKTADTIVAINNDIKAQIFKIADFGVVTDLFEFLPILIRKINEQKEKLRK